MIFRRIVSKYNKVGLFDQKARYFHQGAFSVNLAPHKGHRHMMPFMVNVESEGTAKCVVSNPSESHKIVFDEPKQVGGSDAGLTPLQASLGALFACEIAETRLLLKEDPELRGMKIGAMRFKNATGFIDERGYKNGTGKLPFQRVEAVCEVEGEVSQDQLAKLQKRVESQSPLHAMFKESGCEMDIQWKRK